MKNLSDFSGRDSDCVLGASIIVDEKTHRTLQN